MECSMNARLLFIGTWNFADDNGNLDRSTKQIKAQIFPADDINCEPLIQELLAHGRLIEYSVSGKKYLHIHNFSKHQVINRPSKPHCPTYEPSVSTPGVIRDDSALKGREGKGREYTSFDVFWSSYPKKVAKQDALKAFLKLKLQNGDFDKALSSLEAAKKSDQWRRDGGKFIPHAATWLNGRRFEDEVTQPVKEAFHL